MRKQYRTPALRAKLGLAVLLAFGLGLLWSTEALPTAPLVSRVAAQTIPTNYQVSVSPSSAFLKARPGATTTHTITVRNNSPFGTTASIRVVDFLPDGSSGIPQLQNTLSLSYIDNMEQLQEKISIPSNSSKNIVISLTVPEGAPEREFPTTILIQSEYAAAEGATALIPTVGSNLIVWVSDRDFVDQKLEVVSLQRPKIIDSFRPLTFEPLVENQEGMSAVASGSATIKNWRGQVLGSTDIYPEVILGKSSRSIKAAKAAELVLPNSPEAASARRFDPTDFNFTQPFWLGPYTVEFTFVHPGVTGTYTTVHQQTVIALPLSLLAILGALAVVLAGGYYYNKKRSGSVQKVPVSHNPTNR